jgi:hypothetical protein
MYRRYHMPGRIRMFIRILSIAAMAATVVGTIYAIASFYHPQQLVAQGANSQINNPGSPPQPNTNTRLPNEYTSPTPNSNLNIGSGVRIEQNSTGNGSPNIISGGNVNIQGR